MIRTVESSKPIEVLRQSSEQMRRAAVLLAEITEEAAVPASEPLAFPPAEVPTADMEEFEAQRQATILQAQRSFAATLKLSQVRESGS